MRAIVPREPHPPPIEEPEELESGDMPVDSDEGLIPTHIPEDPERGRMVDPEDRQPTKARPGSWGCTMS